MLVLEATSERQGERDDDYNWCNDGELAYHPGTECADPDCGCDRDWVGVDTHRATTTVQVVDRPELTVTDLADRLAESLSDCSCNQAVRPSDLVVRALAEEIAECAIQFGEGAVLERKGALIQRRHDDRDAERRAVVELTEGLAEAGPIAVLDLAARCICDFGPGVLNLCRRLRVYGWYESSLLEKGIGWLLTGDGPESLLDPDTPKWLHELGSGVISAARRRKEGDSISYLIELEIAGELAGSMQLRLDDSGRIDNAFAVSDPIDGLSRLLTSMEVGRDSPKGAYRQVVPRTAVRDLRSGRDYYDDNPTSEQLANPWPRNRALVDFVLDRFHASGQ